MPTAVAVVVGLLLSQSTTTAPAATAGQIAGRVTIDNADTPVAGARILLLPAMPRIGAMGMPPQTLSDQDGRFVFDNLTPGAYRLEVQKSGFAPLVERERASTTQVGAGRTTEVAVRLQKGAVITGKLVDSSGEPVTDARITAMRRVTGGRDGAAGGRLIPAAGGGQQTNDLGEFRLAGLAPGEYFVAAMPRGGLSFGGPAVTPAASGSANTTTYYPGTIDQAAAQAIDVAAGETVTGIVFSLQSVPSFRISGTAVDENGNPVAGAMVMLTGDPRANAFMGPAGNATTRDDGRFTIDAVPSGTYRITASLPVTMNGSGGAGTGGVVGGVASGSVMWWSIGGETTSILHPPPEVIVNGGDVSDVHVVVQRSIGR